MPRTPTVNANQAGVLVLRWCRARPVTLLITAAIVVLSLTGFILTPSGWGWQVLDLEEPGVQFQRHWWGTVTSLFAVADVAALIAIVPVLLIVLGAAEKTMGSIRTLVAYVVGGVAASFVGLGVGVVEDQYLGFLPLNAPAVDTLSPLAAVICTAMAASSFAGALWRRRTRLLASLTAVTLFLYEGAANDLFAIIALPIGLGLGFALGGRRSGFRIVRSSHHETRVLLAALTFVTSVGPVIATFSQTGAGLLSIYGFLSDDPVTLIDGQTCAYGSTAAPCPDTYDVFSELQPASGFIALLPILVAVLAAWGILKGRRAALWLAVVFNVIVFAGMLYVFSVIQPETVAAIAQLRDTESQEYVAQTLSSSLIGALVPLIVAIVLVVFRRDVRAASTPAALRTFGVTVGVAAAVNLLLAFVGSLAAADGYTPNLDVGKVLVGLPLRLLPPTLLPSDILTFVPSSGWAQAFWYLPPLLFWLAAFIATARLVLDPGTVSGASDRSRARLTLERGGGDTLSFMTTWEGNAYWFSPDVDAGIAYRVHGPVAVTLGGAFGPDARRPEVVTGFVEFCGDNGWTPVFYSVEDGDDSPYAHLGWQRMPVAEEALLDPATWNTAGKKRQDIRTATNRAAREGVTATWTSWHDLTIAEHAQIREISEAWVADKSLPEMEFTLGGVDQLNDPAVRLMLAMNEEGRIQAVTSWLPLFDGGAVHGYTLDFMRRRADSMNGIMEFVIGAAADHMKAEGLERLSLSGSPLASRPGDDGERAAITRVLDRFGELLEPAYGFRSLLNFKRKFQPEFVTLWAVYPEATVLPSLAVALARSYLPHLTLTQAARMAGTLREPREAAAVK